MVRHLKTIVLLRRPRMGLAGNLNSSSTLHFRALEDEMVIIILSRAEYVPACEGIKYRRVMGTVSQPGCNCSRPSLRLAEYQQVPNHTTFAMSLHTTTSMRLVLAHVPTCSR